MKKILLTRGKIAIVDDEDFSYLNRFNWNYYPGESSIEHASYSLHVKTHSVKIPMSHFIFRRKVGYRLKHKNGNGLDYRKENLVYVTFQTSKHLARKQEKINGNWVSSQYKGVHSNKIKGKRIIVNPWRARIEKGGIAYNLGQFRTEEEAALAYNKKAKELYGEFAYQNEI